jgi:hypothetical protein
MYPFVAISDRPVSRFRCVSIWAVSVLEFELNVTLYQMDWGGGECMNIYYYYFTAIGCSPGGSSRYTGQ